MQNAVWLYNQAAVFQM